MLRYGATKLDSDKDGIACETLPRTGQSGDTTLTVPAVNQFKVLSVGDGDTLTVVNEQGSRITVRLACVDAPEMAQKPYGEMAARRLRQLTPVGTSVTLRVVDRDRYNRTVAEVSRAIMGGAVNVNLQTVTEGQAVVYRQYLGNCSASLQRQLVQAEQVAKQQRLGFWQQANPVLPEIYRRTASR
jgi:micrococcal nuclease